MGVEKKSVVVGEAVMLALAAAFAEVNRFLPYCSVVTVLPDSEGGGLLWLFDARAGFDSRIDTDALDKLLDAVHSDGLAVPVTFSRGGVVLPEIANMTYMLEIADRHAA